MSIRKALIRWPCLHGSMHLVTAILPCHHSLVRLFLRAATSPSHLATCHIFPPWHLPHRPTVAPATPFHRATCHIVPLCHLPHRPTVAPATPFHRLTCHTVPPATTMPLPCSRDTWCATVAACRRVPTRHIWHIGIPPYTHASTILYHAPDICQ